MESVVAKMFMLTISTLFTMVDMLIMLALLALLIIWPMYHVNLFD